MQKKKKNFEKIQIQILRQILYVQIISINSKVKNSSMTVTDYLSTLCRMTLARATSEIGGGGGDQFLQHVSRIVRTFRRACRGVVASRRGRQF